MGYTSEEGTFNSAVDGLQLFARRWAPATGSLQGVVVLAHGFQEHSGRYEKLAKSLCPKGIALYTMDHRGHGKSGLIEKKRAYFKKFDHLVQDFDQYVSLVWDAHCHSGIPDFAGVLKNANPPASGVQSAVPMFIMGHSMGGLIATNYMIRYGNKKPFAGLALSAPFFASPKGKHPNCFIIAVNKLVAAAFPKMPVAKIDASTVSRDKSELEKYVSDPLNCKESVTSLHAREFISNQEVLTKQFAELKLPLLILHGTKDDLTGIEGAQLCYDTSSSQDKTFSKYEGGYHELMNDLPDTQAKSLAEFTAWFESHLQAPF